MQNSRTIFGAMMKQSSAIYVTEVTNGPKIHELISLPDLVSSPSTSYACEGSTLTLSCPRPGLVLRVIRANFGRFSVAVCNDDVRANLSVNCMAPRTLRIMQNR